MGKVLIGLVVLAMAAVVAMAECSPTCGCCTHTVKGVVSVTKDDAGAVTSAKVDERAIAVDDNGKKVAAMVGKKVEVTGKIKDSKLVVETVKAVEEPAAK